MSRQQRRRAERDRKPSATLEQGIEAMHAECGGALVLQIIRPPEALALILQSAAGDSQAASILDAFGQMLRRVETMPPDEAPVCVACSRLPAWNAYNVAVALPMRDAPGSALAFLVCEACGTTTEAIQGHAVAACREIWPDLRQIRPTHAAAGHA